VTLKASITDLIKTYNGRAVAENVIAYNFGEDAVAVVREMVEEGVLVSLTTGGKPSTHFINQRQRERVEPVTYLYTLAP
jgi:hypothetical protein